MEWLKQRKPRHTIVSCENKRKKIFKKGSK